MYLNILKLIRFFCKILAYSTFTRLCVGVKLFIVVFRNDYAFYPSYYKELLKKLVLVYDREYAIGLSSGSAALMVACEFIERQFPDATILLPEYGFPTLNSFVDQSKLKYYTLSGSMPEEAQIRMLVEQIPGQVILVWSSLFGLPISTNLMEFCTKKQVKVLHDASHAHTVLYQNQYLAPMGDWTILSLQASKTIPAGEGGVIITNDIDLISYAVSAAHFSNPQAYVGNGIVKDIILPPHQVRKLRMNPLGAVLANENMKKFQSSIISRRTATNVRNLYNNFETGVLHKGIQVDELIIRNVEMGIVVNRDNLKKTIVNNLPLYKLFFNEVIYQSLDTENKNSIRLCVMQPWVFYTPNKIAILFYRFLFGTIK